MATSSSSGHAVSEKHWTGPSNGVEIRILSLMQSTITFQKLSNTMEAIAERSPAITILMIG